MLKLSFVLRGQGTGTYIVQPLQTRLTYLQFLGTYTTQKVLVYICKLCKTYQNNIQGYISSLLKRAVKDAKDLIQSWFTENYLFPDKAELMCFFTSLTATQDSDVNCDRTNRANLCKYLAVPQ